MNNQRVSTIRVLDELTANETRCPGRLMHKDYFDDDIGIPR
jgi:hypothetical protein